MSAPPDQAAPPLGLLTSLRAIERASPDKPRIGRSLRIRDEAVRLGQDPFLAFPGSDLAAADTSGNRARIRAQFLGFFGPHGALPLHVTEEVLRWFDAGDEAFVAFVDILVTRFQQLYFRSWSDAQPITQFDRPQEDRFRGYMLALAGIIGPELDAAGDGLDDIHKARLSGLFAARVHSPVRLRQMLQNVLEAEVQVEEFVPGWLEFEPDALCSLGARGSTLGRDMLVGARARSVTETIRIHIHVATLPAYRRFLPGQTDHARLKSVVHWYLGPTLDVEVALWLPQTQVIPAQIGQSAELGYMASLPAREVSGQEVRAALYRLDLTGPPPTHHADAARKAA